MPEIRPELARKAIESAIGRPSSQASGETDYPCPFCRKAGYTRKSHLHVNYSKGFALCLSGTQGVVTRDGVIPIYQIRPRMRSGIPVWVRSYNFATRRDVWRKVTKFYDNGPASTFLRIVTDVDGSAANRVGVGTVCTPNHPFFRMDGTKVLAEDLVPGDCVRGHYAVLTKDQEQVILGTLLGDAHAMPTGRCVTVEHGDAQRYYLEWKLSVFPGSSVRRRVKSGAFGHRVSWQTALTGYPVEFGRLRKEFYPHGTKIIPESVLDRLTPLGLAVWFMDDGTVRYSRSAAVSGCSLCTEGFDDVSLVRAQRWFARCGMPAQIYRKRLVFDASSSRALLAAIRPYVRPDRADPFYVGHRATKRFYSIKVLRGRVSPGPVYVTHVSSVPVPTLPRRRERWGRYCIEVAGTHNFYLSSGVLVSNCHQCGMAVKSLYNLVRALLGSVPRSIENVLADADDFEDRILAELYPEPKDDKKTGRVTLPEGFQVLTAKPKNCIGAAVYDYLVKERGVLYDQLSAINAGYCVSGKLKGYAIFPVYVNGEMVTWTSRKVTAIDSVKARHAFGADASRALFNYDNAFDARIVVVGEGPFDAWAWSRYSDRVAGVATLGTTLHKAQARLLDDLPAKEIVVCYDGDAADKAQVAAGVLYAVTSKRVSVITLPEDAPDVDEMGSDEPAVHLKGRKPYDSDMALISALLA